MSFGRPSLCSGYQSFIGFRSPLTDYRRTRWCVKVWRQKLLLRVRRPPEIVRKFTMLLKANYILGWDLVHREKTGRGFGSNWRNRWSADVISMRRIGVNTMKVLAISVVFIVTSCIQGLSRWMRMRRLVSRLWDSRRRWHRSFCVSCTKRGGYTAMFCLVAVVLEPNFHLRK